MLKHTPHPRIGERESEGPRKTSDESVGLNGRIAAFVAKKFGSMWTFYILVLWMFGWILLASAGIGIFRRDPYPFIFLLFLSNLVQLLALPILAVGQQVLSRASDRQAEQTFKDAEAILKLEDEIHRLIKINNRLTEEIHAVTAQEKRARRNE